MTNTSFLPEGYELKISEGGNYLKIQDGETVKIRVLTNSIQGYQYFRVAPDGSSKPVRQEKPFDGIPADSKDRKDPKVFRAFAIYNYNTESVQIWVVNQITILNTLLKLYHDEDFGDPKGYDIKVSRTGKGNETRYTVMPLNKAPFDNTEALKKAWGIRLEALYDGEDPFKPF